MISLTPHPSTLTTTTATATATTTATTSPDIALQGRCDGAGHRLVRCALPSRTQRRSGWMNSSRAMGSLPLSPPSRSYTHGEGGGGETDRWKACVCVCNVVVIGAQAATAPSAVRACCTQIQLTLNACIHPLPRPHPHPHTHKRLSSCGRLLAGANGGGVLEHRPSGGHRARGAVRVCRHESPRRD